MKYYYKVFVYFETITSGATHQPYLCWVYNGYIQQGLTGINHCAIDM